MQRSARPQLGRAREHDLARAKRLRKVVRRKADAAFRQIEAEIAAHRPAEPRVVARIRRPGAFDQTSEHDEIGMVQARFQGAEDADAAPGLSGRRTTRPAIGTEDVGILVGRMPKDGAAASFGDLIE